MEEIGCCLGVVMNFRQPGRMNIFSSPSEVIPLTNIFRDQPQNPNHVTLKLSLSHVTFNIRPSCISITNCDLTKKFILFDYLYTRSARTCPRLSTHGGSCSCPSSSSSSIDEARKIKVEEASRRVLIILGVREFAPFNARTMNIDNETQKSWQRTLNLAL